MSGMRARIRRFLGVALVTCLGVGGCAGSSDGLQTSLPTQTRKPRSCGYQPPDVVSIVPPPGWKLVDLKGTGRPWNWALLPTGDPQNFQTGIFFACHSTPYSDSSYLRAERDQMLREYSYYDYLSSLRALEARTIGGADAEGIEYRTERLDNVYLKQSWLVWREDGEWSIDVYGSPNAGSIPQELLDSLDTVKWTRRK